MATAVESESPMRGLPVARKNTSVELDISPPPQKTSLLSRSGSGSVNGSPERTGSMSVAGDDSLDETLEEYDGEASRTPNGDAEHSIESSLAWFRGRVQSMLRIRSDRVDDLTY